MITRAAEPAPIVPAQPPAIVTLAQLAEPVSKIEATSQPAAPDAGQVSREEAPPPAGEVGEFRWPAEPPPRPARSASPLRINPNTAEWWELDELPGIGEVKARAIVAFREKHLAEARAARPDVPASPAFTRPEDLAKVKGIGPATVEKLRPLLTFDDSPPAPGGASESPRKAGGSRRP